MRGGGRMREREETEEDRMKGEEVMRAWMLQERWQTQCGWLVAVGNRK